MSLPSRGDRVEIVGITESGEEYVSEWTVLRVARDGFFYGRRNVYTFVPFSSHNWRPVA